MSSKISADQIVVITDASCFIILHKVDALHLLHQVFATVITTPEIAEEYGMSLPQWVTILSVKNKTLQNDLSFIVDPGEASAIALAHEIENNYLITDDLQARRLAIKLGLPMMGTLGVLLLAKQNGLINLVAPYLELIKQTNFRMAPELFHTVLKEAGEI
ncbi:DUF3368 domain-containing protein [Mucilaginibacter sp. McL0603]|uniref:DUF3368 domain-containing protein n=1 Tax=Mucilaginibacter sp. McL0603 TaxID=3415670 RepID=UPI003CE75FFD